MMKAIVAVSLILLTLGGLVLFYALLAGLGVFVREVALSRVAEG